MDSHTTLRKIVVTGSNKGIGYSIIEILLASNTPYELILTARNPTLGEKAIETLRAKYPKSLSKLIFRQLDISDEKSVSSFVEWVKNTLGKLDVLVNNAAILYRDSNDEQKISTIYTNFTSVIKLIEKITPLLAADGKIINVSSTLGQVGYQGETLRKALEDPNVDFKRLQELANNFLEVGKDYQPNELGTEASYPGSKALLNIYTSKILPAQLGSNQQAYSVCPGWCRTDMGTDEAWLSQEEGADTPVYLIELPFRKDVELNGKFFSKRGTQDYFEKSIPLAAK